MATDKEIIEFQVRMKDFMTKELKRLGLTVEKTSKKGKKGFDDMGRSAERAGKKIKGAGGGLKGFAKGLAKFGRVMAGIVGLGAGLGGLITVFTKVRQGMTEAMAFSQAMAEIGTISEEVRTNTGAFTEQILDLATAFGQNELKTAKGLYQTISAGITDTAEAMFLLESASKLAVGGFAEINVVVDFLTGVINAYGKSVYEAEELTDLFFETVRVGKTTIPEMAKQMGAVMPIAANLGVSIQELQAMLATLTLGNIETSLATTYMRQALVAVIQPTEEAKLLIGETGIEFSAAKIQADGFVGILKELRDRFGDNIAAMQKFFPNVRSFIPVLALAGNQWEKFNEILEEFSDLGTRKVSPTMQALETAMLSAGKKMEVMGNSMRQGFMMLGLGLIEGMTGPINSLTELEDVSFKFRDSIASLKPIVEALVGVMIGLGAAMAGAFSMLAEHLPGVDPARARLMKEDFEGMSSMLGHMAMGVAGGTLSMKDALDEMSSTLRSGREELIMEAIKARSARDDLKSAWAQMPGAYVEGAERLLASGRWRDSIMYGVLREEFSNLFVKDLPQTVLDSSPALVKALKQYYSGLRNTSANQQAADDLYGASSLLFILGKYPEKVHEIVGELKDAQGELQIQLDTAMLRLPKGTVLGSEEEERAKLKSFQSMIDEAILEFAASGRVYEEMVAKGLTPGMGKGSTLSQQFGMMPPDDAEDVVRSYTKLGGDVGQAFWTALAFEMEDDMEGVPDNLRKILEPKLVQALGLAASKGGEFYKRAIRAAVQGVAFTDMITYDAGAELALQTTIGNITKEMALQVKAMSEDTEPERLAKKLYMKEMELRLEQAVTELKHRQGSMSKTLLKQEEDANVTLNNRLVDRISITAELAAAQRALSIESSIAGTMPDRTAEEQHLKKMAKAHLDLRQAASASEKAVADGTRTGAEHGSLIAALSAAYERFKVSANISEEFRKTSEAMQEQIFLVEAGWDESTVENFTSKSLELARLRHESDVAEYTSRAELAGKATEEINAHVAAMGAAYQREVDEMVNGGYKLGSAWDELIRDSERLREKWEQIGVDATNMLVDGLTEGMLMMAKGADEANRSWKDFSRNFLNTVAMMIMRLYMMKAVMAAMNMLSGTVAGSQPGTTFTGGGSPSATNVTAGANGMIALGGLGPMTAYANGGLVPGGLGRMVGYENGGPIVSGAHTALIGEGKYNEAVVPLPDGKSIPVQMAGGGGTNISISINAVDAKGVDELLVSRQDTLRNIIRQAMTESRSFRSTMMGQTRG